MNLITGGTGLIGSHLMCEMLQKGWRIKATKRPSSNIDFVKKVFGYYSNEAEKLFQKIEWVDTDILDYFSVKDALHDIKDVYHCAAIVSFNPKDKNRLIKNNIEGTRNIVNACLEKPGTRLCHVSSIGAIGESKEGEMITEKHLFENGKKNSPYSISKYYSELEVWRGFEEGLDAVIVNPSVVLGPGNWNSGSSAIFQSVYNGLKYYTPGCTGFVNVKDVATIMIRLMEKGIKGERYIISAENLSFKEVLSLVSFQYGKKCPDRMINYSNAKVISFLEKIRSRISGSNPLVTKDSIKAFYSSLQYSNDKICQEIDFEFRDIKKTISDICEIYKKENEEA